MHLRLSMMYGALFLLFGVQMPYLPVWLDWKGLGADTIAIVLAVPMILRVIATPMIGVWADTTGNAVAVARIISAAALIFTVLLAVPSTGAVFFLLVVLMMIAAPSLIPLSETVAMAEVRRGSVDYGAVRLWGSLTFIVANVCAGLAIDAGGGGAIIWMMIVGNLLVVVALTLLSRGAARSEGSTGKGPTRLSADSIKALVSQRSFVLLLLTAGLLQASHAVFYVYGALHWRSLGYSAGVIGLFWAIGVIAEIILFHYARHVLVRIGAVALLLIGGGAAIVRWSGMALEPPFAMLLVLQSGHALTYAATHIGTMHLISRIVPQDLAGTAQSLLATFTSSVAMSGAILIAGFAYVRIGGLSYLFMTAIGIVGVILALRLKHSLALDYPQTPADGGSMVGPR